MEHSHRRGQLRGSNYRDKIILSLFENEFDQSIENEHTIIDGGTGSDSLEIVAPKEMKASIVTMTADL